MSSPARSAGSYRLRAAVQDDQKVIRALVRSVGINPLGLDWPRFLVAVDSKNRILGCAQVKEHGDGSRELASVAVRPPWRGQGIAAAMIRRLIQDNAPPVWLTCRSTLTPFYRRFGFEEVEDDGQMPRLLRRVRRLMNGVFHLLPNGEYLAVMAWWGTERPDGSL
ncbi:MAG TPA: GNAT family N-acetyltransferase [Anaerolineales bacterium]|nr:GNAT family N-acetyltransferase [Anaerolineales bacterium]